MVLKLGQYAFVVLGLLVPLLVGCQGGPKINGYIESMAAERRQLEDRVYQLEYDLDVLHSELEHARAENDRLRSGDNSSSSPSGSQRGRVRRPAASSIAPEGDSADNPAILKPPTVEPGEVESEPAAPPRGFAPDNDGPPPNAPPKMTPLGPPPGRPAAPPGRPVIPPAQLPAPVNPPAVPDLNAVPGAEAADAGPGVDAGPANENGPASEVGTEGMVEEGEPDPGEPGPGAARGDSTLLAPPLTTTSAAKSVGERRVATIDLIAKLTGGVDLDDSPGDDGVTVALDLRDDDGQPVHVPGPISVVLIDLAAQGPAARVARWDLDADQVRRLLPDGRSDEGFVLHMAWPQDAPKRERLQLHVRYMTADGRKLETYRDIVIRLPGQRVSAATPASSPGGWRTKSGGRGASAASGVVPASAEAPLRDAKPMGGGSSPAGALAPLSLPPLPEMSSSGANSSGASSNGGSQGKMRTAESAPSPARPTWRAER